MNMSDTMDRPVFADIAPRALSGARIEARYRLRCVGAAARELAELIGHEHTVELSAGLLGDGFLAREIVGRVEALSERDGYSDCRISYAGELGEGGLPVLLTLVMGNAGFFPQVELVDLVLPERFGEALPGPRFGTAGVRALAGRPHGPLTGTALKPLGAGPQELARIAGAMARGGIEILKEDDGLSAQPFARFEERVQRCADAVAEANAQTGSKCLYFPNVSGALDGLLERALRAQELGAGGLELLPGPMGLDAVRMLSAHPDITVPVAVHSAWQGALCRPPNPALSLAMAFGVLPRLAGADISIMPCFGGRFGLSRVACGETGTALRRAQGGRRTALSMPGGGVTLDGLAALAEVYGADTVLLLSGALFAGGRRLEDTCRIFAERTRALAETV
ncbi:RuBisCO large subunit C-terminal-like domain-containing protein [Nitratireductor sp. StC3]|uniref:RuBisCO large subunit C-terminal-like domain-containing protein n=1 Tax=Nitratireductor sp. StC3 TaxID=2126741 RepID=UPI000D0D0FB8|nr:RuBisCO large subunit C-terminal-like domain-containing protein [Nitratireductor sp. StC3]PSM16790.1 ribulose 1,5-bisphosphate carboxylase large subunit [Nitratireductor sp. StC3]